MLKYLQVDVANRIVGLDVMRSLAILVVIFGHYINYIENYYHLVIPGVEKELGSIISILVTGFDGVDLFFVLSGFLIARSLLNAYLTNTLTWKYLLKSFWIKRWFRTLPNYIFILLVLIVASRLLPTVFPVDHKLHSSLYFIFCQNASSGGLVFFPESWSLSVEEWFYIVFPLGLTILSLVVKSSSCRIQYLLAYVLIYILVGNILRFVVAADIDIDHYGMTKWNSMIRTSVISRFDSIIYGCLMALFKIHSSNFFVKHRYRFLFAGVLIHLISACSLFVFKYHEYGYTFYYAVTGCSYALFLPFFHEIKLNQLFLIRVATTISVLSYSMYLVNYYLVMNVVEYMIRGNAMHQGFLKLAVSLFFLFGLSLFLYKYIELPFMKLRNKHHF